jgi:hypothetical protein
MYSTYFTILSICVISVVVSQSVSSLVVLEFSAALPVNLDAKGPENT